MTAPSAFDAVERWLFAPGSARRLAAVRIGLCLTLAVRLARGPYAGFAGQPSALFQPRSFTHLLSGMPSHGVLLALQVAGVAAALAAAAGLWARATLPAAWAIGVFLNGLTASLGKVTHNDLPLLLALIPLLAAPVAEAWSVASLRTRSRSERAPDNRSVRYGWPVRTAMVVVAGAYFFSGIAKLETSGLAWVTSDNLRFILYAKASPFFRPNGLTLLIADRPWLAHLVAAATILVEAGFPVVLWRPRAAWFLVPGAIALHLGIRYTLGLDYWAWIATLVVLFVDWPRLADRVAPAVRAGAVTRASRLRPSRGTSG